MRCYRSARTRVQTWFRSRALLLNQSPSQQQRRKEQVASRNGVGPRLAGALGSVGSGGCRRRAGSRPLLACFLSTKLIRARVWHDRRALKAVGLSAEKAEEDEA